MTYLTKNANKFAISSFILVKTDQSHGMSGIKRIECARRIKLNYLTIDVICSDELNE